MKSIIIVLPILIVFVSMSCKNAVSDVTIPEQLSEEKVMPDYLPLKLGNKWYYDYKHTSTSSYSKSLTTFKCNWEVVNMTLYTDRTEYLVNKYFYSHSEINSYRIYPDTVYYSDTTFFNDTSATFVILYYKNDTLVINDTSKIRLDIRYPPFKRHKDSTLISDTLNVKGGLFKVGIGYLGFKSSLGMFGTWRSSNMALDSAKLK